MGSPRGTTNRNQRGGSKDRLRRRQWLVDHFGKDGQVECHQKASPDCLVMLTVETVSADRYPIPGCDGGTYRRGNIRPGCPPCQSYTGGKLGAARAKENRT